MSCENDKWALSQTIRIFSAVCETIPFKNEVKMNMLTVSVLVMDACDLASGQNLNVEADADVTVKPSLPLYAEKIFFIRTCCFPLAAASSGAESDSPCVLDRLSITADNLERSKDTAQNNPIKKQEDLGPRRRHLLLVNSGN